MKIMIEMPDNWIDFDSPVGFTHQAFKQLIPRYLKDVLVEQYLSKQPEYKLEITEQEVKNAVIAEIARRQVDKLEERS